MSPVRSSFESHEVVICWLRKSGLCKLSSITNRGLSNVGVGVLIMPCSVNSHKLENVCIADRRSI
jgi:hypothetical protein